MECSKCGQIHEKCTAHNREGKPCKKWPMQAQKVCATHGGSAKQNRDKAKRVIAAEKIASLGLRREGLTPEQLVTEVVERAGADLEYVAQMAQGGDPVWVKALGEVTDRAARVGKIGVDANLGARAVAVEETKVEALLTILQEGAALIPAEYSKVIMGHVVTRLREIEQI